uniref:Class I SAM-dependent rRNA methyltransferase n=1 Tax=Thermodesulfobacterium geofontis TaxID=1295609 RepID=A0A7V6CEG9_9BACT
MKYPIIKLNKNGVKRYLENHLWFSSKEIFQFERIRNEIPAGSIVDLTSEDNFFLGRGYFNPKSYYSLKLLTKEDTAINEEFFLKRFSKALKLREYLYPKESCFRLIFSEGDFLPGLIIDIYENVAVVQIQTLGMERLKNFVINALKKLLNLKAIVLKNDSSKRLEEDLELYVEIAYGKTEEIILAKMDEIKFLIPILKGQKSGFFLDQRENRRFLKNIAKDLIVLDGFSYIGAFSFYALKGGAKKAYLIDKSDFALSLAEEIAKINGWKDKIITIQGDILQILKNPPKSDILILDPPAFIKTFKDRKAGEKRYEKLYFSGIKALEKGFLFAFSCSYFLKLEKMKEMIKNSLKKLNKEGTIIFYGSQAGDHPINPFVEETFYLKGLGIYIQ